MKLKLSKQTIEEKDYSKKSSNFLIPMSQGGSMIQPRKFLPKPGTNDSMQINEFTVTAPRLNKPQVNQPVQNNALFNEFRSGPEGVGVSSRKLIEAFKPEFDHELKMTNDSTSAFNNMLINRNINAPRTRTMSPDNRYNTNFLRESIIKRSSKYNPL